MSYSQGGDGALRVMSMTNGEWQEYIDDASINEDNAARPSFGIHDGVITLLYLDTFTTTLRYGEYGQANKSGTEVWVNNPALFNITATDSSGCEHTQSFDINSIFDDCEE